MNRVTSLYIHFPYCTNLCNYCDFFKKKFDSRSLTTFHDYLMKAYDSLMDLLYENSYALEELETIYIGGGSPSIWGPYGAEFLNNFFKKTCIEKSTSCEFTIEANPDEFTNETLNAFSDLGVNRFSFGVQTTNSYLLKYLDRSFNLQRFLDVSKSIINKGHNISIDLLLGLPNSEYHKRDIIEEIDTLSLSGANHYSAYFLKVPKSYKYYGCLPSEKQLESEYLKVADFFQLGDFLHYEVSNFALAGHQSKHNFKYWKLLPMAALGPTATGFLPLENGAIRFKGLISSPSFRPEKLDIKQIKLENFYLNLRTNIGISPEKYFIDGDYHAFLYLISSWQERGLAVYINNQVFLTSKGYLLLDSLMSEVFQRIGDI